MKTHVSVVISVAAIVLGGATAAQAGPPLICHAIDIGPAKSLPLADWNHVADAGYDLNNLTRDTLAILDANPAVLVHMETLRRATLFARDNPHVAKELLTRLLARANDSNAAGQALAAFDLGYLAETYQQWLGGPESNPASGLDGYGWVKKAISLRGQDAEMEFAAALITLQGPESEHAAHVRNAVAGAGSDPLLARNLASRFNNRSMSDLLANSRAAGY